MIKCMNKVEYKKYRSYLKKQESVKIYIDVMRGNKKYFPRNYWENIDKKESVYCIRYLIDIVLNIKREDIEDITLDIFRNYQLGGMIEKVYDNNLFHAFDSAYPDEFLVTDFKYHPKKIWTREFTIKALADIVKKKNWTDEDIINNYSNKFLRDNHLYYPLRKFFNGNSYELLNSTFPGKFKPYELKNVPLDYWNEETISEATIWMVNKLGWDKEDIKKKLKKETFEKMGLGGMLAGKCNNSPFYALDIAYKGEFKRWEIGSIKRNYWNEETGVEAFKYYIDKVLLFDKNDIKNKLTEDIMKECNLDYMLKKAYEDDIYKLLEKAYPGEFKIGDLKLYKIKKRRTGIVKKRIDFIES